jgi:hypothetical protein
MKEIQLTQNKVAIVDDEDFEYLNQFKWHYVERKSNKQSYAGIQPSRKLSGPRRTIVMHREIMNAPKGKHVDHINHNTLDNRKKNLRICSCQENLRNKMINRNKNTSGFKGVSWNKQNSKWKAEITVSKKNIYIGYFINKIDAALAYDEKAKELFKEFACTNFGSENSPYILITT